MADFASALQGLPDEAVQVNQRALIDKVLARYSGESTVYRELLQNADDAMATHVEIKFLTSLTNDGSTTSAVSSDPLSHSPPQLPDLSTHKISRIMVRNNGIPFRDQDWARLRKIAEGNPDESKIGAFGVGFYALWSICDSPIVLSGPSIMGFNWSTKNPDQLVTRRGANPSPSSWTTFVMDLRSPSPIQAPFEFCRFLATSLAFTTQIKSITMWFDCYMMCNLEKKLAAPQPLSIPSQLNLSAPMKIMKIQSVQQTCAQIEVQALKWTLQNSNTKANASARAIASNAASATSSFASRMLSAFMKPSTSASTVLEPPTAPALALDPTSALTSLKACLSLRIVSGNIIVNVSSAFSSELERATKKSPPKKTQYDLIWINKDEFDAGKISATNTNQSKLLTGDETARAIFDGLISDLDVQGRVFIGFPTHQKTGFSGSIAARFIPTVERESLDLQARYVADWNRELLAIGGILARVVYEGEMEEIGALWKKSDTESTRTWLTARSVHAMQFFTFYASTPAVAVSVVAEESFYRCSRSATITLPSSSGPLPASRVRLPHPDLAAFIKDIPVLPLEASKGAQVMVSKLRDRRLISEVSLEDVFKELENRVLSVDEMKECLNWWIGLTGIQGYDRSLVSRFLRSATFKFQLQPCPQLHVPPEAQPDEVVMSMSTALTFVNVRVIPSDVPVPSHCLPFCLTKSLSGEALRRVFGFKELSVFEFIANLFSSECLGSSNITNSPQLAERLLNILTKAWPNLSCGQQEEICTFLKDQSFIPTRHGMKRSVEAYHDNVTLFQDLAVVSLPSGTPVKGTMEKVLTSIGVRKHVELQMVFSRLLGSGEWNHADLVKYLVSVKETLTDNEVYRLRHTNWLPKEGEPKVQLPPGPDGKARRPKTNRYTASYLYEPSPTNQLLQLPLLEWPSKWRSSSEEAKLLFFLGLKKQPEVDVLLQIAANPEDLSLRERALVYFLEHFADYRATYRPGPQTPAFVPCNTGLFSPSNAFSNPEAAKMGFNILQNKYQGDYQKFGIMPNPTSATLIKRLIDQPPSDAESAKGAFEYLSSRVSDFSTSELQTLGSMRFVPLETKVDSLVSPSGCFFQPQEAVDSGPFKSLFTYIDFGPAAKPFLSACGVKNEPTVQEMAEMVIADPAKFYGLAGSAEEYLQVLRNIATNQHLLGHNLKRAMQRSAFLLGSRRVASSTAGKGHEKSLPADDDEEELEAGQPFVHVLALPSNVVIIDDSHSYSQFTSVVVACPQEEVFERLAESLGAPRLTRIVKESFRIQRANSENNERTEEMRKLLIERTALFLHERQSGLRNDVLRDAEWLKRHLQVKQVEGVALQRDLTYAGVKHFSVLQATATAAMEGRNTLVLYLVRKVEIDWFELASSVCKLILGQHKLSDSLFFMTILQTSLKNLKRRGMNVDRIINARKAEREAAQQQAREEILQRQLEEMNALKPDQLEYHAKDLEKRFPDANPDFIRQALSAEKEDHLKRVTEKFSHGAYERRPAVTQPPPVMPTVPQRQSGIFTSLRKKLLSNDQQPPYEWPPSEATPSPLPPQTTAPEDTRSRAASVRPPTQATPLSDIRNNLLKAISASKPDSHADIRTLPDTKPVKESEQSYCDPTGAREDLSFLTTVKGLRFYVSRKVSSGELVMMEYGEALNRYAEKVVKPVGEVFNVDPRSLHLFYDLEGPAIAFNRNGSLFFNLRYYLAWYDDQVRAGNLADALIGTFSTFAHELAHNLVEQHNSEHEWWMSAFIEQYFLRIATYIASVTSSTALPCPV